jgi:DNA-binding transcriptional ArsR family regulator
MDPEKHPSISESFELLSSNRRRLVFQYLKQHPNPIALDALAARVARWEQAPAVEPPAAEIESVRESLRTTHLRKLSETGLISYDDGREEITSHTATIVASLENARNVMEFLWQAEPDGE